MLTDILGFLVCAAFIVYSGTKLSVYGDQLASLTGLSRAWLGLVLMASVTSMPELLTGYSAAALVGAPDLAVGNVLGSCLFNILVIAMVDLLAPRRAVAAPASLEHLVTAAFGILMLGVVGLAFLQPAAFGQMGWLGGSSLVLAVLYPVAMYAVFRYGQQMAPALSTAPAEGPAPGESITAPAPTGGGLRPVLLRFGLHALVVMGSALALPYFSEHLAEASGLGQSFFGTFALALTTSLPELVVSLAAVRLGSLDMALGNLLGSNLCNLFLLAVIDATYTAGPLLAHANASHLLTLLGAIALTAISLVGLVMRPARTSRWSPDTVGIVVVYGLMAVLLYQNR